MTIVCINDIRYIIKNESDLIQRHLLAGHQWNKHIVQLIKELIIKAKLTHFVNVGSHIGTVSLPISKVITKVTAVEPFPPSFEHLVAHIQLNNIANMDTLNCAFGNSSEPIFFMNQNISRVKNNTGGMHVFTQHDIEHNIRSSELSDKSTSSRMVKMDDLNIDAFDIMLIDVEGCEYDMLLGARSKILQYKPIIIIEIWNDVKRNEENMNTSQQDVLDLLVSFGYTCQSIYRSDDYLCIPSK